MQFGVQAAFGSSLFIRLVALRSALRCVASIIMDLLRFAVSSAKMGLETPSRLRRMKRLWMVICGPYSRSSRACTARTL
ncbi:hypothetical protein DXM21_23210 [Agrobacterium rosae]|nr:hypothetical protein DXM21_23210 [Agrobacterium rosae]KAA3513478.1 hypothetical protein DXM25_23405 [Agrobacterium rosae]MQB51034.1 hypothetical protein [Agrobacterium rosae]